MTLAAARRQSGGNFFSSASRAIKNQYGETIEIKCGPDGSIKIRHSDIDPKAFGEFHEYAKRLRQPHIKAFMEKRGVNLTSVEMKETNAALGGYVVLRGKTYIIDPAETALIYEAIKDAGGTVPNWSNRP